MLLSICIPAFNEQDSIAQAVREAFAAVATLGDCEVVVVDDGSTDRTPALLEQLALQNPGLRVIHHARNLGHPCALQTLIQAARGEYIVQAPADLQWDMQDIPRLFAKIQQGYDVVIGVRRQKQYTLWRKLVSFTYNALIVGMRGSSPGTWPLGTVAWTT